MEETPITPCETCISFAICKTKHVKPVQDLPGYKDDSTYIDTIDLYHKCSIFDRWWRVKENRNAEKSRIALTDLYETFYLME